MISNAVIPNGTKVNEEPLHRPIPKRDSEDEGAPIFKHQLNNSTIRRSTSAMRNFKTVSFPSTPVKFQSLEGGLFLNCETREVYQKYSSGYTCCGLKDRVKAGCNELVSYGNMALLGGGLATAFVGIASLYCQNLTSHNDLYCASQVVLTDSTSSHLSANLPFFKGVPEIVQPYAAICLLGAASFAALKLAKSCCCWGVRTCRSC